MAGLVPAIHDLRCRTNQSRGRAKSGHDGGVSSSAQPGVRRQQLQIRLRPRAIMADDLRRRDAAHPAADRPATCRRSARSGTRRHRRRPHPSCPAPCAGSASTVTVSPPRRITLPASLRVSTASPTSARASLGRLFERVLLIQAGDLDLVGEQDVDMPGDQLTERFAMAVDAERVRQRQRHLPPGGMRRLRRLVERRLRRRRIEQVAFQICHLRRGHEMRMHIRRRPA